MKINYSTAKTLLRNERLKKGKIQFNELDLESESIERTQPESADVIGTVCSFKTIQPRCDSYFQDELSCPYPKIEIVSRISFPSA